MQNIIVYDKAKYHFDAENYPKDLPMEQAYVHTGMFLGWVIDNDLFNKEFFAELGIIKNIEAFKNRSIMSTDIYQNHLDGVLTNEDLNEEGNSFAQYYFDTNTWPFIEDYSKLFGLGPDEVYSVEDTWENYSKVRNMIDKRYMEWNKKKSGNFLTRFFSK